MSCDEQTPPAEKLCNCMECLDDSVQESPSTSDDVQLQSIVRGRVLDLITQAGYEDRATESIINEIAEMVINETLKTEDQLAALLGIEVPSQTIGVYRCHWCTMTFSNNLCLQNHISSHHNDQGVERPCEAFEKDSTEKLVAKPSKSSISQTNSDLQVQTGKHTVENCHQCDTCGNAFSCSSNLQRHMRIHTGEKLKCSICGQAFNDSSDLRSHMRIHTGEKLLNCLTCGKSFLDNSSLQRHIVIHTGEKPFKCSICGIAFTRKSVLQSHIRIHAGERPFKCSKCGIPYTHCSNLLIHMRIHTGEKTIKCSTCGDTFTKSSSLYRHMRIHTGEKIFECSTCGKALSYKFSLQRHMRIHTGEKPLKCSTCGMAFIDSYSRQKHMRIHAVQE